MGPTWLGRLRAAATEPAWLGLGLVLLAVVLRGPALSSGVLNPDEAYVATQAQVILDGGELYRDAVDRKPPGLPYLVAAVRWLAGDDVLVAMRLVDAVAIGLVGALVAAAARPRWGSSPAAAAGALTVAAVASLPARDGAAFGSETWVALGTVGALVLIERGRLAAAAGALAGAVLFRQTAVLLLPALALAAWPRWRWRGLLALAAAPALALGAAALALGWRDTWFWIGGGASTGYLDVHGRWGYAAELAQVWLTVTAVAAIGLVVLVPAAVGRWRRDPVPWVGVGGGLLACTLGLRFFPHYGIQLLPWLAIAVAGGWAATAPGIGRRSVVALAAVVCIANLAAFRADEPGVDGEGDAIAAAIELHSEPGDPIFIWGHAVEYHLVADRPPATRFLTSSFLTGYSGGREPGVDPANRPVPGAWARFEADVAETPPVVIVDVAATGARNGDAYPLDAYPVIRDLVAREYEEVPASGGLRVYVRRG